MQKIKIPMFQCSLLLYGPDEKKRFEVDAREEMPGDWYGCCKGQYMWIGNETGYEPMAIAVHELVHFIDWVLENRLELVCKTFDDSGEIRAYMMQWLFVEVKKALEKMEVI
jgi:hypothetical protein